MDRPCSSEAKMAIGPGIWTLLRNVRSCFLPSGSCLLFPHPDDETSAHHHPSADRSSSSVNRMLLSASAHIQFLPRQRRHLYILDGR